MAEKLLHVSGHTEVVLNEILKAPSFAEYIILSVMRLNDLIDTCIRLNLMGLLNGLHIALSIVDILRVDVLAVRVVVT